MACVTLKRPLEFDTIYSHHSSHGGSSCSPRAHKRRKLLPMSVSSRQPSQPSQIKINSQPRQQQQPFEDGQPSTSSAQSAFVESTPTLLKDGIAQYVREELRRLRRQRLLQSSPDHRAMDDNSSSDDNNPSSTAPHTLNITFPSTTCEASPSKDKPLFSFRQVVSLCEKVLKDRDSAVRKEYEDELVVRKAEQYDSFVRFSEDQLQFSSTQDKPTYLS